MLYLWILIQILRLVLEKHLLTLNSHCSRVVKNKLINKTVE